MAKTKKTKLPVWQPNAFKAGNKAAAIPEDQKKIRYELKRNFYKAADFLNMSATDAKNFVAEIKAAQESGIQTKITVFEVLIVDAITARRWDLINKILDRIFPGQQGMPPGDNDSDEPTILDELSNEQKQRAVEAAAKAMAHG